MKPLAMLALLLCSLFTPTIASPPYTLIENQAKLQVLSPTFAERKTLKIQLENGLQAYLISDPNTDKSGAAITVMAGSLEDPKEHPGIAHFLEHMLFLGTKKYPSEAEFDRFLGEHDGASNAFTANYQTSFMFAINNDAFEQALDRFSEFFKYPLFNPSGVSRELNAIDQEYSKNVENDDIRVLFIRKEISNPDHPFSYFNMGNKTSLATVSQEALKTFYHEKYSANEMRLIVCSTLPLETLRDLIVADFSGIRNFDKKRYTTEINPISAQMEGHILYVEPVKNIRTLSLIWTLPPPFAKMKESKPEAIVGHVLGDEGKGSLLWQLKQEKLASALRCGRDLLGLDNLEFYVEIDLTDKGIHELDTVILRCFQTIANLKNKGIPEYLYDEIHQMGVIDYQYQPRIEAFNSMMQHAIWSGEEDLPTYPEQSNIVKKFDPEAIQQMLQYMTPQHAQIVVLAPAEVTGVKPNHQERWLGGAYASRAISPKQMQEWSQAIAHQQITLPPPNPFIPQTLQLVSKGNGKKNGDRLYPTPKTLIDDAKGKIYFAQDSRYRVPKIYWTFTIRTPSIEQGDAEKMVLGDLYVSALREALTEFIYPASVAGLNFSVELKENGAAITVEGYNANAHLLFKELLKRLKAPEVTEQRFKVYKETLSREYQNFAKEMPLRQAVEILKRVIHKHFTTEKEKAAAIKKVSYEKFRDYVTNIFEKNYIEGMMYGNQLEKDALEIAKNLFNTLDGSPYPKEEQEKRMVIILPEKDGPFILESKTRSQGNAVILSIEDIQFSFKSRASQQILMQAMKPSFFEMLRTKQQTGYIVDNSDEEIEKRLFSSFLVQSNTHDPRDLLSRFELFIEGFLQEMEKSELPEGQFKTIAASLQKTLEQPPKTIREMGEMLNTLAFKYDGDFDWIEKRIQAFKELNYSEFLTISRQVMGKGNKRRIGILLKGVIPPQTTLDYRRLTNLNQLIKQSTYEQR